MDKQYQKDSGKQTNNQSQYAKYRRAALIKGPEFYKSDNYVLKIDQYGKEDYEIIQKIGRGKYSDVFKCININDDKYYVLKVLKPVRQQKIKRQIKILSHLKHQNVIKLHKILNDATSNCNILVFEYVDTADYRDLIDQLGHPQIKKIIYDILLGLKYCHSQGIMHRDIKPQNLLIDKLTLTVKIADWGLADYYLPDTQYNVRVASRHYKGPQLLLNNKKYDYSLDIWSLGIVLAGFLFRRYTIFRGDDNVDQLNQIMKHFGSIQIQKYIKKYSLIPEQAVKTIIKQSKQRNKRSWKHYIDKQNQHLCDNQALDLLDKMLQIDHVNIQLFQKNMRINVLDCMNHPYFDQIKK